MAAVWKVIKRHDNVEYAWCENRRNSAYASIIATHRKTHKDTYIATIKLKTGKVTWENKPPQVVVDLIESTAMVGVKQPLKSANKTNPQEMVGKDNG